MILFKENAYLTDEQIYNWIGEAESAYKQVAKKRAVNTTAFRLSLEEILLRFRELYGTGSRCRLYGTKSFGNIRFEVSQKGPYQNPLDIDQESDLSYDILVRLNMRPNYEYKNGINKVSIPVPLKPRKNALLISIFISVLLALLTWFSSSFMPETVRNEYLIPTISNSFGKLSSVFSELATPLVFFAVVSGICGIGGVSTFGKLGGSLLKRMMGTYFIAMIAMVVVGLAIGLVPTHAASEGGNIFSDLLKLVLDIIPSNLITPFQTDNDMQVIVIAIFIGIVLLLLGDKVRIVRKFCDEAGSIINQMMAFVCKTLPLFVYLGVTNLLLSNMLGQVYLVSRIFVISLAGAAITIGITIARTLYVTKQPFSKLFSAQLPSLLINLTTSSQMSAMPESMKCCKEKWGIDQKFTDFGLPLGVVFYMPNGAIMLGAIVWVLTDISLGAVDIIVLLKLVLVSVIIAIAAPPIPGSAFAVLPILFSACGTNLSMMPLAVIIGSTVGYLLPAMNGFCLQLELLMTAKKANLIRKEDPPAEPST